MSCHNLARRPARLSLGNCAQVLIQTVALKDNGEGATLDEPLLRGDLAGKGECRHMGMRLEFEQITDGTHDKAVYQ